MLSVRRTTLGVFIASAMCSYTAPTDPSELATVPLPFQHGRNGSQRGGARPLGEQVADHGSRVGDEDAGGPEFLLPAVELGVARLWHDTLRQAGAPGGCFGHPRGVASGESRYGHPPHFLGFGRGPWVVPPERPPHH